MTLMGEVERLGYSILPRSKVSNPKLQMKQKRSNPSVNLTDRITREEFSKMSVAVNDLLARGFSLEDIACDCGMSGGWWSHVKAGNDCYLKIKATYLQYKIVMAVSRAVKRSIGKRNHALEKQREFASAMSAALLAGVDLLDYSTRKAK